MSSKRKNQPASDNKLKLSPEEKRCRENPTESEKDEDPGEAVTMAAKDEATKLDTILNKLKKLDNIEGRLEDVFKAISSIGKNFRRAPNINYACVPLSSKTMTYSQVY